MNICVLKAARLTGTTGQTKHFSALLNINSISEYSLDTEASLDGKNLSERTFDFHDSLFKGLAFQH